MTSQAPALAFASAAHAHQKRRDSNEPYVEHCKRVAQGVEDDYTGIYIINGGTKKLDTLVVAALLHDTVEDTPTTCDDIRTHFGDEVASLVAELTSNDQEINRIGKTAYLSQKLQKLSFDALYIKLHDRHDNLLDYLRAIKNGKSKERAKAYAEQTLTILQTLNCVFSTMIERIMSVCDEIKQICE